jgi:hypothetical protein
VRAVTVSSLLGVSTAAMPNRKTSNRVERRITG